MNELISGEIKGQRGGGEEGRMNMANKQFGGEQSW